ncbi:MAG TPA: YraN family protein [Jatrophihabitantaceae bacterium]|jgi:putative endonuclease
MRAKDAVGQYGQRVAEQHLVDAGLSIIARNWRCSDGELDLIATEGPVLVFCEVKTRSSTAYGDPAEAVLGAKALRLRRLALRWLAEQKSYGDPRYWPELRFDVVSVLRQPRGAASVRHLRGVLGW